MSYYDFGGRIITAVAKTASLDFDFSITAAYGGTGGMSVTGMGLEFTIGNTPLGPGIGTTEIYGSFGTAFAGTWSGSNIDLPLLTSGNISGHFHFDVQYDEIKVISPNTNLGGHAYPQSDLSYEAHVKPGYAVNALCTVNGVTTSISQAIAGSGYFLTYETTIQVSAACSRVVNPANPIAGFSYLISTGAATASVTGITYDAGPWTPIPWTSTYPDLPAGSQGFANPVQPQGIIAVSSGSVVCFAPDSPIVVTLPLNPIGFNGNNVGSGASVTVVSAPTQPVAISGVILKGNDPSTDTIPCAYTPNSVNTLPYPVLNAPGGVLNTTLTRYHSRYLTPPPGVQNLTEGTFTFTTSPPVPQDYIQGNLEGLFIGGTYMPDRNLQGDSACYRFDDTSWYVTTFAHAASVVADAFTSNAGWTAINGTLTGSGVGIVVSSLPATLAHPTGYAKDFRNYRYVVLDLTTNMTGSVLSVEIGSEIFTLPALINGSNSIRIDLCAPNSVSCPDDSKSNWEGFCGNIRGVAVFDNFQVTGFQNGETVTLNSLTLTRSTAKGLCIPEDEPWNPTSYLEWYNPALYTNQINNGFSLTGATVIRACVLRDRADGKPAADIPCAVSTAAAALAQVLATGSVAVGAGDRLNVADFITAVNAQVGLSCTAGTTLTGIVNIDSPGDGLGPNPYSPNIPAAFLTLDSATAPGSLDTDMSSVALNCLPFYADCARFIGQQTASTFNFIKRLGGAVHGLVITPGGPVAGINVLLTSPDAQPPQSLTTDADGYYRSAAQWPAFVATQDTQVTLTTDVCSGQVYIRTRAWRFLGLGGTGTGGCNDLLNTQFGFYVIFVNGAGNLVCKYAPHGNFPLTDVGIIDTSSDCGEPHICNQSWTGLLSVVYSRGKGTIANPYRIYRAVSLDYGQSWQAKGMVVF